MIIEAISMWQLKNKLEYMKNELKNIKCSLLELDIISQGSNPAETFKNSLILAQKAEEFGYHRFWLAEHHNAPSIASSATSILIGHIAGGTKKIRVGSGGIMLPNHSPLIVAEQFGTLGNLYPNRIDLGLGRAPGTDPLTANAIRSDRMQSAHRFPEEVQEIQRYFSPENRTAKIRAVMAEGVDVPIYILGSSTDSAHLSAKSGLPYAFASHFATGQLMEALSIYRSEFKPSAFLPAPYLIAGVNIVVAETQEEADAMFTSVIKMFFNILRGVSELLQPPQTMTEEFKQLAQHPLLQQMLKYSFVGTKEVVREAIIDFVDQTGADELMVATNVFDIEARIKSYQLLSEIMNDL